MIIGNKNRFAIELQPIDKKIGFIRLWINSNQIGSWEETYFAPVIKSLLRIKDYSDYQFLDLRSNSAAFIFNQIIQNEEDFQFTLLGFGETFDKYEIRGYAFHSTINFLWKDFTENTVGAANSIGKVLFGVIVEEEYYNVIQTTNDRVINKL